MKRRQFIKSVAAAATAPLVPSQLAANPLPVSPEAYAKAVHWAGLWVHSTAATYQNILGVDYKTGVAVFQRLQMDGILGMTDGIGVAKAVTPYYEIPQVAARLKEAMAKPVPTAAPKLERPGKLKDLAKDAAEVLSDPHKTEGAELSSARRPTPRPVERSEPPDRLEA